MASGTSLRPTTPPACGHLPTAWGGRSFVVGLDVVFVELHEAMAFVEAVSRAAAQHFQPHRQALRISLGQQHFQDCRAEPAILVAPVEIERVDLDFIFAGPEADAARPFVVDQDQPQAGLVEMLAEDPSRARGLLAEYPFQMLAHDVDAQRQQRFEVSLAHRAETPDVSHEFVSRG